MTLTPHLPRPHRLKLVPIIGFAYIFISLHACTPIKPPSPNQSLSAPAFTVVSLNVFGYKTMPQAADKYAEYIREQNADIVGIQEGVQDWALNGVDFPSDYSRAEALTQALGKCWKQRYQILINTCQGNTFVQNYRWDLTDGDFHKATRTGETAIIRKGAYDLAFINIHWEAFNTTSRAANVGETINEVLKHTTIPTITLGDFNSTCNGSEVGRFLKGSSSTLIHGADIDCITGRNIISEYGHTFSAKPSDHPGISASVRMIIRQ